MTAPRKNGACGENAQPQRRHILIPCSRLAGPRAGTARGYWPALGSGAGQRELPRIARGDEPGSPACPTGPMQFVVIQSGALAGAGSDGDGMLPPGMNDTIRMLVLPFDCSTDELVNRPLVSFPDKFSSP